jgi:hypothetical protein
MKAGNTKIVITEGNIYFYVPSAPVNLCKIQVTWLSAASLPFSGSLRLYLTVSFAVPPPPPPLFFLILTLHYSPMRTLASLMAFSQSALLFVLSFQFLISHVLISIFRRTVVHNIGAVTNTVAMLINTANTNYIETSLPCTSH